MPVLQSPVGREDGEGGGQTEILVLVLDLRWWHVAVAVRIVGWSGWSHAILATRVHVVLVVGIIDHIGRSRIRLRGRNIRSRNLLAVWDRITGRVFIHRLDIAQLHVGVSDLGKCWA